MHNIIKISVWLNYLIWNINDWWLIFWRGIKSIILPFIYSGAPIGFQCTYLNLYLYIWSRLFNSNIPTFIFLYIFGRALKIFIIFCISYNCDLISIISWLISHFLYLITYKKIPTHLIWITSHVLYLISFKKYQRI